MEYTLILNEAWLHFENLTQCEWALDVLGGQCTPTWVLMDS